jgi:hypothetical protein
MRASYQLVDRPPILSHIDCLVIRDVGTGSQKSVTNDAEEVVGEMLRHGSDGGLMPDERLFYYDSEQALAELCHDGAKFVSFGPAPAVPIPPLRSIRDYIAWELDARREDRDGAVSIPLDNLTLFDVPIDTHIGLRFIQQWTLASELASHLQMKEAMQVFRAVVRSMDVEWRG